MIEGIDLIFGDFPTIKEKQDEIKKKISQECQEIILAVKNAIKQSETTKVDVHLKDMIFEREDLIKAVKLIKERKGWNCAELSSYDIENEIHYTVLRFYP